MSSDQTNNGQHRDGHRYDPPVDVDEAAERLARRPWPATPLRPELEVSFEFFPTATPEGAARLNECAHELAPLEPSFVSVTYGAGGTSQDRTIRTLTELKTATSLDLAGHLTTVSASRGETLEMVDRYLELGVTHIVALRGDQPADRPPTPPDGFRTAAELVAGIRNHVGDRVEISVACYPEVHPRALSPEDDLDRLKEKIDAGADRTITQFFYDNDDFLRFRDRCHEAGISVPIVAGIMPIGSFSKTSSFAARCGAKIPPWMPELFSGLEDAPEIHQLVSATVAAEQCRELAEQGVRNFHFYTMNRPELTAATCRILGIRPRNGNADAAAAGAAEPTTTDGGAGPSTGSALLRGA
ncbi:MAG: methylenetetrahydrofolate reductase [NAD(P)H] [Acidimicrobiales bacterium]